MKHGFAFFAAVSLWLSVQPITATFAADFSKPEEILAVIPKELLSDLGGSEKKFSEAASKVNEHLIQNAENKTVQFKVQISAVDTYRLDDAPTVIRYRLVPTAERLRTQGATLRVLISIFMDPTEAAKCGKLRKGDKVTVAARIGNAEIEGPTISSSNLPTLSLSLSEAKLE